MATFNEIINSNQPVLVDFFATWCGPCKTMSPILDEVAKQVQGKARVLKIDVDKNQQAAAAYQVRGVPTLILFKNGKQLWRQSGVVDANQLVQIINQHS
ncbi:MAG: thioredoxin [Flavobacteriales bacterium BRH_c54]|nr:MAG: thioredoxin [Flavobacteriales bacterium BRH_c54]